MPNQGQGFELVRYCRSRHRRPPAFQVEREVFLGTIIGVYIMSVLRAGLPSMDLQSQYQTFFTGVVVLGAVLLDIYRTKRATEVRVLAPSAKFKAEVMEKILRNSRLQVPLMLRLKSVN